MLCVHCSIHHSRNPTVCRTYAGSTNAPANDVSGGTLCFSISPTTVRAPLRTQLRAEHARGPNPCLHAASVLTLANQRLSSAAAARCRTPRVPGAGYGSTDCIVNLYIKSWVIPNACRRMNAILCSPTILNLPLPLILWHHLYEVICISDQDRPKSNPRNAIQQ
jgi:hypothetical protein